LPAGSLARLRRRRPPRRCDRPAADRPGRRGLPQISQAPPTPVPGRHPALRSRITRAR
jgi:hypothetical protein